MSEALTLIDKTLRESIQKIVDVELEEFVQESTAEFERRIRRAVGQVAINISDYFSVQRLANELVIHVKIEEHPHGR